MSTWNMARAAKSLNFQFYLYLSNFNVDGHMWPVAALLDSPGLEHEKERAVRKGRVHGVGSGLLGTLCSGTPRWEWVGKAESGARCSPGGSWSWKCTQRPVLRETPPIWNSFSPEGLENISFSLKHKHTSDSYSHGLLALNVRLVQSSK